MSIDYAEIVRLAKLGRRTERRGKALEGCVTALATKAIVDLFGGWMLMFAIGVAHHEWVSTLPTIGYWWAVLLVVLTRGLFVSTVRKRPTPGETGGN